MNIILLIYLYNFLIELDVIVRKYIKQPTFNIFGWAVSSVGRASRLHRGGQRFESFTAHQRPISIIKFIWKNFLNIQ